MFTHSEKLLFQNNDGIVLCRGINTKGDYFWLYIRAEREAVERMHRDAKVKKAVNFLEYGAVIHKGIGEVVPVVIKREMEDLYNFKHDKKPKAG